MRSAWNDPILRLAFIGLAVLFIVSVIISLL